MRNPAISYTFLQKPSLLLLQFIRTLYNAAKITYFATLAALLKLSVTLSFPTEQPHYRLSSTRCSG